jgi:hypothetical protein
MIGRIFISYRRADSQYATDRIYERLVAAFGEGTVFMDIDDIPLGVNFRDYIDQQVSTSSIVIAVIGDHWLDSRESDGNPRLHNPSDFVRLELEATLRQGIKLVPVFIGDVKALPAKKLPNSLQELPMLNATRIRRGQDFLPDVDRLIRGIEHISEEQDTLRDRNKAALKDLKQSASEIQRQLSQFEALMIQEMRLRTRLEKQAQNIEAQVSDSLSQPGRMLLVDISAYRQEIEKLTEGLNELALQIEARKQGLVIEEEFEEDPKLEIAESRPEPVIVKPAPRPKKKLRRPKVDRPGPDIKGILAKVPIWVWGGALVLILSVIFGPDLYRGISTSLAESVQSTQTDEPTKDPGADPADQEDSLEESLGNQGVIEWIDHIDLTTPDFIEDFSIPQAYWYQDGGIEEGSHAGGVTDGVLRIVKDTEEATEVSAGSYPFGENALLMFGFNPVNIESNTAVLASFREAEGRGYSFYYQANGDWDLASVEGNNRTILARGNSIPLESGEYYLFSIFAYHNILVIKINGQVLSYEIDGAYSEGGASIAFIVEGALEADFDNIQIWNLSGVALYEDVFETHDVRARGFYRPIRDYLANAYPDFFDEFDTPQSYWEEVLLVYDGMEVGYLSEVVADGEIALETVGKDNVRNNFTLNFPQMHAEAFAIQYDFSFIESGSPGLTTSLDTSWGPEDYLEYYSAFCDFDQTEQMVACGLYRQDSRGRNDQPMFGLHRSFFHGLDQPATLFLLFFQNKMAIFLDGHLMGYAEDLEMSDQQIAINFDNWDPEDDYQVKFHNIRFWDLSTFTVDINGDLPSDETIQFASMVLSHTKTQPPDFQEDFETPQPYWNQMRLDTTENYPVELSTVVHGGEDRYVSIDSSAEFVNSPIVSLMFEQAKARFFAYQFDFKPHDMQQADDLMVFFSQTLSEGENSKEYHFVISPYQDDKITWKITSDSREVGSDQEVIVSGFYDYPNYLTAEHQLSLFVAGANLLVLLDQNVVAYYSGLDLTESGIRVHTYFGQPGPQMNFDNFKFWNLDGVSLSGSE